MKIYYVTLVRSLSGYCVKFLAPDEEMVRAHVGKYYGLIWCSVYTKKPSEICINEASPVYLTAVDW